MDTNRDRARLWIPRRLAETGRDFGYQERQGKIRGDSGYQRRLAETLGTERDKARLGETLDTKGDWRRLTETLDTEIRDYKGGQTLDTNRDRADGETLDGVETGRDYQQRQGEMGRLEGDYTKGDW